ncbi:hypothetical protein CI109_104852 [Kwoniella shandongensis]|uniref:Polysaccharide lyase 14 domain-containing protein n=1 Tax=Kwoniella shandongensis TaxID=1734106 RepID=A0A5M6BTX8_9TREE|nr:uncharacterized protein CI109_006163 [Kwoniella shandongensis]KAA5525472.1 hypothetical protein CI109_006163 [Kwoniella shandongensis]
MHASTLLYALPLLSLSFSATAAATPNAASVEARALYEAASRNVHHGRNAHVASVGNIRRMIPGANGHDGQKLVRRKKSKRACKVDSGSGSGSAATSTSSASETTETPQATTAISAVNNVAVGAGKHSSTAASESAVATSSSSTSAAEDEYPTSSAVTSTESAPATATSTSSAVAETSAASSGSSYSSNFFPWGTGSASWTTSDNSLSFTGALKPLTAGKLPPTSNAPDGSSGLTASYPSGTVGLSAAGFSFYTEGAHNGVAVDSAKEVSMSYSVYLQDGFQFQKGGKMPGLYGGTSLAQAKSCSGGRQDSRDSCFSARLMWRTNGAGEVYDYLPVPYTETDTGYGESIERGAYTWATGRWQTVAIRVKLNDVGQANGEQELVVDGQSVINLTGLTFATTEGTRIYGIMAQTFFGGHTDDWASPQDQKIWFKDWSLATLA